MKRLTLLLLLATLMVAHGCSGAIDAETNIGSVIESDAVGTGADGTSDLCPPANCLIDGACYEAGARNPINPCESCVPITGLGGWTALGGEPCDDADPCTSEDQCVENLCTGEPLDCDDGQPCTTDSCESGDGGCVHETLGDGEACDDGEPCTTGTTCSGDLCAGGLPIECDDENPCTTSACTQGIGCVHTGQDGLTCEDGDACTGGGVCVDAACTSSFTITCDDESVCTADGCDAALGCVFTDISELCEDENPCTNPLCDASQGCVYAFNALPCDDDNVCTEGDQCDEGMCRGDDITVDDDNPCTDDACEPETGISHLANQLPCDDADGCTLGDTCADSQCAPGTQSLDCDDQNVCTSEACEPATGCVYTDVEAQCDDLSVCTLADHCESGSCVGDALSCDDQNSCTTDSCDPVDGCSSSLVVSQACRPQISITFPLRAATILGDPQSPAVVVTGSVSSGAGPITSLSLNGASVTIAADGSFLHELTPVTGGNTLVFEAVDSFGTARTAVQSFHWSVEYVSDAPPQSGFADPGMGIFLSQEVLDDGDHSLPADDLATIIELAFANYDVSALIPTGEPVVEDEQGYDVYLKNPSHDSPTASLVAIDGGLLLGVKITNLEADLEAKGLNWWTPNLNGSLEVSTLSIESTTALFVNEAHQLEVDLLSTNATITGANVNIDSWLAFIVEPIINAVLDDVLDDLEEEIAGEMEGQIAPMIADTLGSLAISQEFSVPSLDPSADVEIDLTLATDFSDTDFASDGGAFILRTQVTGPTVIEHEKLGAVARGGCGTQDQPIVIPRSAPLEVVLVDDTLNLLLFRAWEGGMLSFGVPPEMLAGTDLSAYGITDLTLTVNGLLAPVVSDCYADSAMRIHLGDLDVTANMMLLGSPLDVQMYLSLLAGFQLSVVNDAISFGLTDVESLDLEVTAAQDAFIASEQLIADLVAENLVPTLLDGLGGSSLGGIPLPSIDLSGAMDGVPPGTVIAIEVETIEHEQGNTIVSGDLQ